MVIDIKWTRTRGGGGDVMMNWEEGDLLFVVVVVTLFLLSGWWWMDRMRWKAIVIVLAGEVNGQSRG